MWYSIPASQCATVHTATWKSALVLAISRTLHGYFDLFTPCNYCIHYQWTFGLLHRLFGLGRKAWGCKLSAGVHISQTKSGASVHYISRVLTPWVVHKIQTRTPCPFGRARQNPWIAARLALTKLDRIKRTNNTTLRLQVHKQRQNNKNVANVQQPDGPYPRH